MKLPAFILQEALSALGEWSACGTKETEEYAYPRLFAGEGSSSRCVTVLSPEETSLVSTGEAGHLAVFTAPFPEGKLPACPALVPAAPVPEEAVWRCLTELYDRMENWEEALSACSSDFPGIQKMLEISSRAMAGDLSLVDVSYHVPASTNERSSEPVSVFDRDRRHVKDATIASLAEDPAMTAIRTVRGVQSLESHSESPEASRYLFRNMFRDGEKSYFNRLLFSRRGGEYSQTDRFMLERLAQRLERITEHLSTYVVPSSEYLALKQQLLRISDPAGEQDMDAAGALSPLGWDKKDRYRFYLFRSLYSQRDAGITDYILRRLERLIPGSCGAAAGERILLIQNLNRSDETFSDLRPRLAAFLGENLYKAGISNEFRSFSRVHGAYLQAEAAMILGGERDPMLWYYLFENYLGDYLVRKVSGEIPADMLLLPAVDQLRQYDELRGTRYAHTLQVYAEENFNATHAARRLYIHRSSFQDRMERILQLTGMDLEDEAVRALLWFSFRLLEKMQ